MLSSVLKRTVSALLPQRTFVCQFSTTKGSKTSKLRQLLDKQNAVKATKVPGAASTTSTTTTTSKSPKLTSATALPVSNGIEKGSGTIGIRTEPLPPVPQGEWGIQMVLEYLKTQKVAKCVVFDTFSQSPSDNYAIICNVPSVRAMYSLVDRLVRQARTYRPKNYTDFASGKDEEGLWSVADMGTIVVHVMTDEGRSSPAFQRFERRLLNEAELVPVSKWSELKDAWVALEEKLINNPPPKYKYADTSVPPPGYYIRPDRPAIVNRVYEQSESEDEFNYHDLDEKHKLQILAAETGETHLAKAWNQNTIEFVPVKSIYKDGSNSNMTGNDNHNLSSYERDMMMQELDEEEDEWTEVEVTDHEYMEAEYTENVTSTHGVNTRNISTSSTNTIRQLGLYDDLDIACSDTDVYDITMSDHDGSKILKYDTYADDLEHLTDMDDDEFITKHALRRKNTLEDDEDLDDDVSDIAEEGELTDAAMELMEEEDLSFKYKKQ